MGKDSKTSYLERKLAKAQDENRAIQDENKTLRRELDLTKKQLKDSRDAYSRLSDSYHKYLVEQAESVERLYEARTAYESALSEIKSLMKEYKGEAEGWISAIKKTRKAV